MKSKLLSLSTLSVLTMSAVLSGCGKSETPRNNFVLVTVDGAVDDVGLGNTWQGFYTTSPSTLPAAASVLTGLPPNEHGLRVNGVGALSADATTLATDLADAGYSCAAFLSSVALHERHGLTNGFERYFAEVSTNRATALTFTAAQLGEKVKAYLSETKSAKNPRFVWVHLAPYAGISTTNSVALSAARASAANDIRAIFSLFDTHTEKMVVPLFNIEEGVFFQGMNLSNAVMHVRVQTTLTPKDFTGSIDLLRRIISGELNVQSSGGRTFPSTPYAETVLPWYVFKLPVLVEGNEESVFAEAALNLDTLAVKPQAYQSEQHVLSLLGHFGEGLVAPYTNAVQIALTDEQREVIRAAEHLMTLPHTNRIAQAEALVAQYPDVYVFRRVLADDYYRLGNFTDACNQYSAAAETGVNMIYANRQQSKCHSRIGNIPMAIDKAENAFLMNPTDPVLRRELSGILYLTGSALIGQADYKTANECLSRVLWLEPKNTDAMFQMARLNLAAAQTNNAEAVLGNLLEIRPTHMPAKKLLETICKEKTGK